MYESLWLEKYITHDIKKIYLLINVMNKDGTQYFIIVI